MLRLDTIYTRRRAISEERMKICKSCEHLKSLNRCEKCGCFMDGKTLFLESECPIGKWKAKEINMNESFDFGDK